MLWKNGRRSDDIEDQRTVSTGRRGAALRLAGRQYPDRRRVLSSGKVREAMRRSSPTRANALLARLELQALGYAVPDVFTHGTSAQRARWFQTGFASGQPQVCDTFNAAQL